MKNIKFLGILIIGLMISLASCASTAPNSVMARNNRSIIMARNNRPNRVVVLNTRRNHRNNRVIIIHR